jgi:hypothetical protein
MTKAASLNPKARLRWIRPAIVLGLLLGGSARAVHLDRIPRCEGACIDWESLDYVVAAAEVEVVLGISKGAKPKVALQRWILKPRTELDPASLKPSACIPDRGQLASMMKPSKGIPYTYPPAIKAALQSGRYSLIVFFGRSKAGEIEPKCALELAINWDKFPIFARRRQWLVERLTGEEHCSVSGAQPYEQSSPADQLEPIVAADGQCVDGLKSGRWRYDHGADMSETGEYRAGRRIGPWISSNGEVIETVNYREGRKNGSYEMIDSSHKVEEGVFEDGLRSGTWRTWDRQGKLLDEVRYRDGARQ